MGLKARMEDRGWRMASSECQKLSSIIYSRSSSQESWFEKWRSTLRPHQRKGLAPLGYRRGWKSYGKQPRQRQCKKTRIAPQKDRAPRKCQKGKREEGEEVKVRGRRKGA